MKIKEEILKEHSKPHALKIANYACASKKNFKELMRCFMSDEYRLAQRAAYSVSLAAKKDPSMIVPYIGDLVAQLQNKKAHQAMVRNSVRILEQTEIPEKFHGDVMNACFDFISTPSTAIAIKAFSLTTLYNLSKKYPEIRSELKMIIEKNWDNETAALRSRGRKILVLINKESLKRSSE